MDRALTLVTLLAERGSLSVTEAGRELGVAPSTAHRLLSTLCHRNSPYRATNASTPGPALLARRRPEALRWPTGSAPTSSGCTTSWARRCISWCGTGAEIRFVDGIESRHPLRVGLRTGARMPAYCTSGGKAMLADLEPARSTPSMPEDYRRGRARRSTTSPPCTRRSRPCDATVSVNHEESEPGVTAIGASIGGIDGSTPPSPLSCPRCGWPPSTSRPSRPTCCRCAPTSDRPSGTTATRKQRARRMLSPKPDEPDTSIPRRRRERGTISLKLISRTPNSRSRSHHDVIV